VRHYGKAWLLRHERQAHGLELQGEATDAMMNGQYAEEEQDMGVEQREMVRRASVPVKRCSRRTRRLYVL